MNKKVPLGVTIGVTAVIAAVAVLVTWFASLAVYNRKLSLGADTNALDAKLTEIAGLARAHGYYEVDPSVITDKTADGYAAGLSDPYADYLTAEEYRRENESAQGMMTGFGLAIKADSSGYLLVSDVMAGSPAAEAGLQPNDLIISVEGEALPGIGYDRATELLTAKAGETRRVTVRRQTDEAEYTLTARQITLTSASLEMNGEIGVITLSGFYGNTADQVKAAVESAAAQGARGLLFDLRDNSGGVVDGVVQTLDYLLPEGVLVTTRLKDGTEQERYDSDGNEVSLPMTVLINENTASAAELFAADLRDFGKAQLVGTQSFGKWVKQRLFPLSDGSALRITETAFYSHADGNYDGTGLTPDYLVTQSADPSTDLQMQKALEVLRAAIGG